MDDSVHPLRSILATVRRSLRRTKRLLVFVSIAFIAVNFALVVLRSSSDGGARVSPLDLARSLRTAFVSKEQKVPTFLWSYIPGIEESMQTPAAEDVWRWLNKQRRQGYRRPSWGALSQQGPKAHIRENLRTDRQYLTLFQGGDGWNNQVIASCNTGRIPLLSPFLPAAGHLGGESTWLSVLEVFDFTEFVEHYGVSVVDMLELKVPETPWWKSVLADRHKAVTFDGEHPQRRVDPLEESADTAKFAKGEQSEFLAIGEEIRSETPQEDMIKCWSATMSHTTDDGGVHIYPLAPTQIEWTPLPRVAFHEYAHHIAWASTNGTAAVMAAYSKPGDVLPAETIERLETLGRLPSTMQPDDPLTCLDRAFFLHTMPNSEIRNEWRQGIGAWDAVGKYLKFQPGLVRLAEDLVRQLLDVKWDEPVPLYLAVHIRRTDLAGEHRDVTQRQWSHMAWEVLHELRQTEGVFVHHILFTTDEKDPAWLDELRKLGWILVEHSAYRTGARLDWWLPTILDSVILSSARIFLGRADSTMSILPYRRVIDWGHGMGRFAVSSELDVPEDWEWREDW